MQAQDKIPSKDTEDFTASASNIDIKPQLNIPKKLEICTPSIKKEPTEDPNINPAKPVYLESIIESRCIVCKSQKIPLFRFPQKTERLKQWLKSLNMNHYRESDFPYIRHKGRVCTHHYRRANRMRFCRNVASERELKQSDENSREKIPEPLSNLGTRQTFFSQPNVKLMQVVPVLKPVFELKLPGKRISRTNCIVCNARKKLVPFPLEDKRLKQWLKNLNMSGCSEADFPYLKQNAKVCFHHFQRANRAFRKIAPKKAKESASVNSSAEAHESKGSSMEGQRPENVDKTEAGSQDSESDQSEVKPRVTSSDAVSTKKLGKSNQNLTEKNMESAQDSLPLQVVSWENINSSFCIVCKEKRKALFTFPQRNDRIKMWLKNLGLSQYPESDYPYIKHNGRVCSYHFEKASYRSPNSEEKSNYLQLNPLKSVSWEAINPTFCIICKSKTKEWLFPFPQTNVRLRQWLQNLNLNDFPESDFPYIKQNARVCSVHFERANDTEVCDEAPKKLLVKGTKETKYSQASQKTSINLLSNKNKKGSAPPSRFISGPRKCLRKRASMKPSCIVCNSMKRRLFSFPKSKNSRMLWMTLLQINREQMSKYDNFRRDARVCCQHFDLGAFTSASKTQLHPNALPNTKYPFGIPNRDGKADRAPRQVDIDGSSTPQSSCDPSDSDALGTSDSRLTQELSYSSSSSNLRTCSTINRKCCIVCKSRRRPLFQFPQKIDRLKLWLKSLNMEHYTNADYKYLLLNARCCASHFDEQSFTSSLKRRITCIAVPRLDLPPPIVYRFTEGSSSEDDTPDYAAILKRLKKDLTTEQFKFLLAQLRVDKIRGQSWTPEDICLAVKEYFQTSVGYEFLRKHMSFTLQAYVKRYLEVKDPEYVDEEEIENNAQTTGEVNSKVSSNSSIPPDVRTCDTISRKVCIVCKTRKKPLFQFPQKLDRMKLWLQYLNMDSEHYTDSDFTYIGFNARICGAHFDDKSFTNAGRSRITCRAIPKLNLGATTILQVRKRPAKTEDEAVELSVLRQLKIDLLPEQYRFLLGQLQISKVYGKCRGWTQEEMSFALKLYFQSPLAYQFLRKHVSFPSLGYLKRFPFDNPQLAEFAHGLREEDAEPSDDSSDSDLEKFELPVEALNEEDFPKIMDVRSLYAAGEMQPDPIVIKRECLSPEPENDKRKVLLSQIQCQIETSHVKMSQLQQRSKKFKQRNTQLPVILMLTEELTRDS